MNEFIFNFDFEESNANQESDIVFSLDKTCDILVGEFTPATYGTPSSENPLTVTLHLQYSGNHGSVTFDIYWDDGNIDYNVSSTEPSHTYANAGSYAVAVHAYDSGVADCMIIYNPTDISPDCQITVSESSSASYGNQLIPPVNPLITILHLAPSGYYSTRKYDIDWGDGNNDTDLTTDEPSHTYDYEGDYSVAVTIQDDTTCEYTYNTSVMPNCTIAVDVFVLSGAYLSCQLEISPSGYYGSYSFYIDWGDGNTTTTTDTHPTHDYASAGYYNISVTISDLTTCTNSDTTAYDAIEP